MTSEQFKEIKDRVDALQNYLKIEDKKLKIKELENITLEPNFWDNPERAQSTLKQISSLKVWTEAFDKVKGLLDDLELAMDFFKSNEMTEKELEEYYQKTLKALEELEFKNMLSEEEDAMSCVLNINAGSGGTESQDWAAMLMRMYIMYAEKHGYKVSVIDEQPGDVAGIKSVSLEIEGPFAYGYLKSENGVHRLVRISPFDANAKRHTSFASVFVYPLVNEDIQIEINPADLEWDTFRASGAGGQHVNRTESAVRVKHIPTGIVVECQQERSQHQNRDKALKLLQSRLYALEVEKRMAEKAKLESTKKKIEWGSQIRNYVFHPYKLVKDLRTDVETSNVQAVMDGELDDFIKAYLMEFGSKN
jgi:peptide chain release factor 2